MVISSEFRMELNRDDDHREDAPHFIFWTLAWYPLEACSCISSLIYFLCSLSYSVLETVHELILHKSLMSFFAATMALSILGVLFEIESILFFKSFRTFSFSRSHSGRQFWLFDNGKSVSKWVIAVLWLIKKFWVISQMPTADSTTLIFREYFWLITWVET